MKTQTPSKSVVLIGFLLLMLASFPVQQSKAANGPAASLMDGQAEIEMTLAHAPQTALPNGNTADGILALQNVTTGAWDSAFGAGALYSDTTGSLNNAVGVGSLFHNIGGHHNVSNGVLAMYYNTSGWGNSASGYGALYLNETGIGNAAFGGLAGLQITGSFNTALGPLAGINLTTGDNNVDVGSPGVAGESNTIRIGNPTTHDSVYVAGTVPMSAEAPNQVVIIDPASGQLGRTDAENLPPGGLPGVVFDYNSGGISVGVGSAVPFNQAPLTVGSAISKTNNTTFTVHENGVYRITYTLRTALVSLLGNAQVQVNGMGVGPTAALVTVGVPLTDQVTFLANAGDTLQLVVGGLAITLATGDNATINIDKIHSL